LKLETLKTNRNKDLVNASLIKLAEIAKSSINIMPFVIDCVENYCTLGEIADVLRNEFGEHR
jgi:methylmalonyl-CoA mutase N-terminal domain/subunit